MKHSYLLLVNNVLLLYLLFCVPIVSYLKLSFMSVCSIVVQNVMTYKENHSGNEAPDGHTHKNICIEIPLT